MKTKDFAIYANFEMLKTCLQNRTLKLLPIANSLTFFCIYRFAYNIMKMLIYLLCQCRIYRHGKYHWKCQHVDRNLISYNEEGYFRNNNVKK